MAPSVHQGIFTFVGHTAPVRAVDIDGDFLWTGSEDGTAKKWNLYGQRKLVLTLRGHSDWVTCCCADSTLGSVFTASADCTARQWRHSSGQCIRVFEGHTDCIWGLAVSQGSVYTGSADCSVLEWSPASWNENQCATFRPLRSFQLDDTVWSLCAHCSSLYVASDDGNASCWDIAEGELLMKYRHGHAGVLAVLAHGEDKDEILFTGATDANVRLFDAHSGELLRRFVGHSSGVTCLALWEGQQLYSGSADKTIWSWDVASGARLRLYKGHTNSVTSLFVNRDCVISGSDDCSAILFAREENELYEPTGELSINSRHQASISPSYNRRVVESRIMGYFDHPLPSNSPSPSRGSSVVVPLDVASLKEHSKASPGVLMYDPLKEYSKASPGVLMYDLPGSKMESQHTPLRRPPGLPPPSTHANPVFGLEASPPEVERLP